MTRNKIIAVVVGAAIALSGSAFAQSKSSASKAPASKMESTAKKPATSTTKGTVKSITDSQLVLEHKAKSGSKDETFVLNSGTQKQGDLKVGAPVTVHYRFENKQDVATAVSADGEKKPAAKAPAKASKGK